MLTCDIVSLLTLTNTMLFMDAKFVSFPIPSLSSASILGRGRSQFSEMEKVPFSHLFNLDHLI